MTRGELVEAAMDAARGIPNPSRPIFDEDDDAQVRAVVDAVEPLIRADLRAKVEALPPLQMRRPDDMYAAYVQRADVLALLDGYRP